MGLIDKATKYIQNHFSGSMICLDEITESPPVQLRNSVHIQICIINGEKFNCVELKDERLFSNTGTLLLNKLLSKLDNYPIIFLRASFKTQTLNKLRSSRIAYIVPGEQCYLPLFFLHSSPIRKFIDKPLSLFSTHIIMKYLEGDIPPIIASNEIELEGSRMSKSRAITELEQRGIIQVYRQGRANILKFIQSRLEIWSLQSHLFPRICIKPIKVPRSIINVNMAAQAGETALANFTLLSPPKTVAIAIHNSHDADIQMFDNDALKTLIDDESPFTDTLPPSELVEIYSYTLMPKTQSLGKTITLSPISIALSRVTPSDERAHSCLNELQDRIKTHLQQLDIDEPHKEK
jgi:hypothetical protein